jgi:hypothetical protein
MAGMRERLTAMVTHGNQIYAYYNIRTNQVIYSLTRSMRNSKALKQLPFLGKKTVPAALRKDLWSPLCLIEFPNPKQGLSAYRMLREYRRLHETQYPIESVTQMEDKGNKDEKRLWESAVGRGFLLPKKQRGKKLMDQKANSVADIAAVLLQHAEPPTEEEVARAKRMVHRPNVPRAKRGHGSQIWADATEWKGNVEGVRISWQNLLDAEFAANWPKEVVHDGELAKSRYTAAWPPIDAIVAQETAVDGGVEQTT